MINVSVTVHGSTPAYFYYMIKCIVDDAVARGIDEESARALAVQTMIGAGELLQKNPKTAIDDFIDEVCSKGGTTIEAIHKMEELHLDEIVKEANEVCIHRAVEMGEEFKKI